MSIDAFKSVKILTSDELLRRLTRVYMTKERINYDYSDQKDVVQAVLSILKTRDMFNKVNCTGMNTPFDHEFLVHIIHGGVRLPYNLVAATEICATLARQGTTGSVISFRAVLGNFDKNGDSNCVVVPMKRLLGIDDESKYWRIWVALNVDKGGLIHLLTQHVHHLPIDFLTGVFGYFAEIVFINPAIASYCFTFSNVKQALEDALKIAVTRAQANAKDDPSNSEKISLRERIELVYARLDHFWRPKGGQGVTLDESAWKHGFCITPFNFIDSIATDKV